MNELMRQAARVQRQIAKIQEETKIRHWSAKTADDKVSATVTGEHKIVSIDVDAEFWKAEEKDVVLDAIGAAINAAQTQCEKDVEALVTKATGGLRIPGLNG